MNAADIPLNEPPQRAPASPGSGGARTSPPSYPASAWTLKYWFKKTGATRRQLLHHRHRRRRQLRRQRGGDHHARPTPPATTPGRPRCRAARARRTRSTRPLKMLPRYDQAANLDDRSHARKMLDALEAELEGRASAGDIALIEFTLQSRGQKRDPRAAEGPARPVPRRGGRRGHGRAPAQRPGRQPSDVPPLMGARSTRIAGFFGFVRPRPRCARRASPRRRSRASPRACAAETRVHQHHAALPAAHAARALAPGGAEQPVRAALRADGGDNVAGRCRSACRPR
jgi:hypothetical protein